MPLQNSGPRGHKYKLLSASGNWTTQRDTCLAMGAWLAFPDGAQVSDAQLELAATTALAGAGYWAGVNDIATEGTYRNSLNADISAITMLFVVTSNPAASDCFVGNQMTLDDEICSDLRVAVCECVP